MWLERVAPKKFICRYTLRTGCFFFGIFMTCVMIVCSISLVVETFSVSECTYCSTGVTSFSVTAIVYSLAMVGIHLWFIWGVYSRKSSVVISWIVITAMWMAQMYCLLIVLLSLYVKQSKPLAWIVILLIVSFLPVYGLLVGFGYWLQLKSDRQRPSNTQ